MKKRNAVYLAVAILAVVTVSSLLCIHRYFDWPEMVITDGSQNQGLAFRIPEVSPSGATIEYVQKNGDVKGELVVEYFSVYLKDGYKNILPINQTALLQNIPLQQGSRASFEIDWTEAYDQLKPGEYYLGLSVYDQTEDVYKNPSDHESYYIPFTLP